MGGKDSGYGQKKRGQTTLTRGKNTKGVQGSKMPNGGWVREGAALQTLSKKPKKNENTNQRPHRRTNAKRKETSLGEKGGGGPQRGKAKIASSREKRKKNTPRKTSKQNAHGGRGAKKRT